MVPHRRMRSSRYLIKLLPLTIILLIIGLWEVCTQFLPIKEYLLPSPSAVCKELLSNFSSLLSDFIYTATEAISGFLLAAFFSFFFSVSFVHSKFLKDTSMPFLIGLKAVPVIAMAPLLILWLGNGFMSKATMAAVICFFPIVVNLTRGLTAIPDEHLRLMRSLSASWWQVLIKIRIPNSMPYFFASLKIATTLSVVGAIVAEFSGANKGIGYVILVAALRIETPLLFCGILLASILGIMLYYGIVFVENKFVYWENIDAEI